MRYITFTDYTKRRDAEIWRVSGTIVDPRSLGAHTCERSLFRSMFKVVNPSRPASPTNSRLLASPYRRRIGSQVIGRPTNLRSRPGIA